MPLTPNCVLQMSYRGRSGDLTDGVLRALPATLYEGDPGPVIVTLGEAGAILIDSAGVHRIPTRPVAGALTVGAGAILSSAIVVGLIESGHAQVSIEQL